MKRNSLVTSVVFHTKCAYRRPRGVSCYDPMDGGGRATPGAKAETRPRRVSHSISRGRNTADGLSRFALREAIKNAIAVLQHLKRVNHSMRTAPCTPFLLAFYMSTLYETLH